MTLSPARADAIRALGYDPEDPELQATLAASLPANLEWLAEIRKAYPLATSKLWRAPHAECDQRRSVIAAMTSPVVTVVLGGERSGKSRGLKELTLAQALGGDHPVTRAWLDNNDLPTDIIPDGPAEVYAVALTSNDSVRYHRPDFAQLVGSLPHTWHNFGGNGESRLVLSVPGYDRPGVVHFKSVDQKARSFQGISIRWAWVDEEPLGHDGKAVYGQLRARVMDQNGRIGISMVPMEGFTWVHDDLVVKKQDGAVPVWLNSLDNPHLPKDRASSHFGGMSDDERAMRQFGQFRSRTGVVYPHWKVSDYDRWGMGHVCHPFPIPADWPKFRGVDFGLINPTAVVWGALATSGRDDGTLYIFREYYRPLGLSYPWHAERVRAMECGQEVTEHEILGRAGTPERIECGWADPSNPGAIDDFCLAEVYVGKADNDVKAGISAVSDRLRLQGDERPRLKVFSTCTHLIEEMGNYRRDPNKVDGAPIKLNDHACDGLRYLCMGVKEWLGI